MLMPLKKFVFPFVFLLFLSSFPTAVLGAQDTSVTVVVDGVRIDFTTPPLIKNGVLLVPIRKIGETLGAELKWFPNDKAILISKDGSTVKFNVGKKTAYINDKPIELIYPATLIKGNILVPLRVISESFDIEAKWDGSNKTVELTTFPNPQINGVNFSDMSLSMINQSNIRASIDLNNSITAQISEEFPIKSFINQGLIKVSNESGKRIKTLIKFDISSLKGQKIKHAYLQMVNESTLELNAVRTLYVGRLTHDWNNQATWVTSDGITNWNVAGATGTKDEIPNESYQKVFRVLGWEPNWMLDITQVVQGWNDGRFPNFGLSLYSDGYLTLVGYPSTNLAPRVVIELEDIDYKDPSLVYQKKIKTGLESLKTKHQPWSDINIEIIHAQENLTKLGFDEAYKNNLIQYFDKAIDGNGNFNSAGIHEHSYYHGGSGSILFSLFAETRNEKYLKAIQAIRSNFDKLPQQDGIYLDNNTIQAELAYFGLHFLAKYGDEMDDPASSDIAVTQAIKLYDKLTSSEKDGIPITLMYSQSNLKGKGWARGEGWLFAGLARLFQYKDVINHPRYKELVQRYQSLAINLAKLQDQSGLWRNIVQDPNSALETSGTALLALGFEFGVHEGILDKKYSTIVDRAINGLQQYSKTGTEMSQAFPINVDLIYTYTDFSSNRYAFGAWYDLLTTRELHRTKGNA